ncbi:hypothetical protein CYG49_03445 [Candidatus Saccharibacteria bacterium]|nr:MAG: hypothetical protein CYG49_03445 [Candidatus Saccharibacteria bacterium]
MIPGFELIDFIRIFGLLGVAIVVFAESGLLIGFFLPGDSLLFTTGLLAQQGVFGGLSIHLIAGTLFIAAAAGDSVGYAFGNKVGRKIFKRKESLLFHPQNLVKAEEFYEKHGPKTIVIARFVPVVRTFAPIIAGVGSMRYSTFIMFNLVGAFMWAVGLTYLGYFVGSWFEARGVDIDHYLLPIIALIILLSILPPLYHTFKEKKQRDAFITFAKAQLVQLKKRFLK